MRRRQAAAGTMANEAQVELSSEQIVEIKP
jgi:hypothetical protein